MLVDKSLGRPIQGVSQQSESLRGEGNCSEQINMIPDPVEGVYLRPNTKVVQEVQAYDYYFDFTDRDGDKLLMLREDPMTVSVYSEADDSITDITVTDTTAFNYLLANGGKLDVAYFKEHLYITNPTVTVLEDTGYVPPASLTDVGIVRCLGGQYSRTYTVTVNYTDGTTTEATYQAPDGTSAAHGAQIASTYIIEQLYDTLAVDTGMSVEVHEDHMMIYDGTKTVDNVTCNDDDNNLYLMCTWNTSKTTEDLPFYAPDGLVVTITGDTGSEDDAYYRFVVTGTTTDTGIGTFGVYGEWVEYVKSGDEFSFDNTTMPVRIKYEDNTLELVDWKGREIGDTDTNPTPSVLDNKIVSLDTFQSRLGLLTETTVVFSRTNKPTELWRKSIIEGVLPTDALDGSGDASTGTHTHFAKVSQDLAVFTKQGQYVFLGNQVLTPDNISLSLTTRDRSIPDVPPTGIAGNLYFVTDNDTFMGVSEYFKEEGTYYAQPITEHVSQYIRGRANLFKGSTPQRMLAIRTDYDSKLLYCYKFLFNGRKRVQSAWFKMQFEYDIKHFMFTGNSMLIVTSNGANDVVERLEFDSIDFGSIEFPILLDRYKLYTMDADLTITPDNIHTVEDTLFVAYASTSAGLPVDYEDLGDGRYRILSGEEGDVIAAGFPYYWEYVPTKPRLFDNNKEVIRTGVLNVRDLKVNVTNTGIFSWRIDTDYGTSREGTFTNRKWGDARNRIGSEPVITRQWTVPWRGKAVDRTCTLFGKSYTPVSISYIEFTGDLRKQRRRM